MPKSGPKCTCNLGYMVVAWVLIALGLWALVAGFATQFNSATPTAVNLGIVSWYFAGVLLIGLAKMAKWKSHGTCPAHGGKMM